MAIVYNIYDNTVLTKVISKIWKQGDIPTTKSDKTRNMIGDQTVCKTLSLGYVNHFISQ